MDELYPLFAVMIFTVAVMFGLIGFFRPWMIQRNKLLSASRPRATPQPDRRMAA